jgi:deoxycytidine triphosphate deaminase
MTILVDHEINTRLDANPPLATGISRGDIVSAKAPVQAASLNLTIGEIYRPTIERVSNSQLQSSKDLILATGQTAVVKTREELNLGDDLIGICFPPASLSAKGLLFDEPRAD